MSRPASSIGGKVFIALCLVAVLVGFLIGRGAEDRATLTLGLVIGLGGLVGVGLFAALHDANHRRRGERSHAFFGYRRD
jgi:fatty acid desaturase